MCVARGLKALVGFGARRYAVIDVGTNSVKFHIGERAADGVVARRSSTAPRSPASARGSTRPAGSARSRSARTVDAIAGDGRRGAAGTAPRRSRPSGRRGCASRPTRRSSSTPWSALRHRDRGHLRRGGGPARLPRREGGPWARVARARSSCSTPAAAAPSSPSAAASRSTSASASNVGAVAAHRALRPRRRRLRRRARARPSPRSRPTSTRLDGRARAGRGGRDGRRRHEPRRGRHGLATYDPDVVQGTVLDRAEIDRQIELYRDAHRRGAARDRRAAAQARRGHPRRRVHRPDGPRQARPRRRSPSAIAACGTASLVERFGT